jgi:hypothetical protein
MAGDAGGLRNCRNCNRGCISRPWPREHAYSCANLLVRSRAAWRGSRPAVAFYKHATMTAEDSRADSRWECNRDISTAMEISACRWLSQHHGLWRKGPCSYSQNSNSRYPPCRTPGKPSPSAARIGWRCFPSQVDARQNNSSRIR